MLVFLYQEGPYTKGVFRRSAGAKACRELRDRLDSGTEEPEITNQSVFVIAAVLKVKTSPSSSSHVFETRQQGAGWTEVCPKSPENRQGNRSLHTQPGREPVSLTRCSLVQLPAQTDATVSSIQGAAQMYNSLLLRQRKLF